MNFSIIRFALTAAAVVSVACSYAQKIYTVTGTYRYVASENESLSEAKQKAVYKARIQALADKFGTVIAQSNSTVMKNSTGQSSVDFLSLTMSDVRGEWLEDISKPKFLDPEVDARSGLLVITCTVHGKVREIVSPKIDFAAKILRKEPDKAFESDIFKNGDQFFLWFKSPTDGWLAVYMIDAEQTAYCLLPYMNDTDGQAAVEGGREYVFFSLDTADGAERDIVDEYVMTTERSAETNSIYVVFSPNRFVKANDSLETGGLPRQLSFADFHKWLAKCRTHDSQMALMPLSVTIRR
ncbi:MAG: DUF4384 domain-containing protein [Alistipes sp.]|nr:DUF4384 domain-containing protein [Alistipes sp.]